MEFNFSYLAGNNMLILDATKNNPSIYQIEDWVKFVAVVETDEDREFILSHIWVGKHRKLTCIVLFEDEQNLMVMNIRGNVKNALF